MPLSGVSAGDRAGKGASITLNYGIASVCSSEKNTYRYRYNRAMTDGNFSYFSPKLEVRLHPEKGGRGVHAVAPVVKGELLALFGGRIIHLADAVDPDGVKLIQVEEELYLETMTPGEPADSFNHSCRPNVGMSGQVGLVAMRDIQIGEEVTFDYAMCDGSNYDEFECACGVKECRGKVTGDDWRRPELWERYTGYFSPYLQRRINALRR
jgi:SET domain-containing protein